ncbi:MAG TPA: DUF2953 domain-containing protein [Desulfatiglandales bacterium]
MYVMIFSAAAILAALTAIILLSPLRLRVVINDRTREVILSWLALEGGRDFKERTTILGLCGRTIIRRKSKEMEKPGSQKKAEEKRQRESRFGLIDLWTERNLVAGLIQVLLRLLWDFFKSVRWDRLRLQIDLATPDPALTGLLYGELCAIKYSTACVFPHARIQIRPDFVEELPRISAESVFSLKPAKMILPVFKAFFSVPKIRIIKLLMRRRRR